MERELTLGERRVGITHDPSEDRMVTIIKNQSAALIDILEEIKNGFEKIDGEKIRQISMAQTDIENGCTHGVKSIFI